MLAANLLVTLFALPFALAQEGGDAQSSDAAPAESGAGGAGGDAGSSNAGGGQPQPTKQPSVGGVTDNTGHGSSANSTGPGWNLTTFSMPTQDLYWVDGIENTASWTPYTEPVDLVIFNSNQSILNGEQKQIAQNIPGGQGSWTGKIEGYPPSNNYILVLALSSNPDRKIGQTRGFWIKRNGTLPAQTGSVQGVQAASSSGEGASATASGAEADKSAPAAGQSGSGSGSGAASLAVSIGSVVAAGALALTVF